MSKARRALGHGPLCQPGIVLSGFKHLLFEARLANMPNSSFTHTHTLAGPPLKYLWFVTASPAWMRLQEKYEGNDPPIKVCQGPSGKNRSIALIPAL